MEIEKELSKCFWCRRSADTYKCHESKEFFCSDLCNFKFLNSEFLKKVLTSLNLGNYESAKEIIKEGIDAI